MHLAVNGANEPATKAWSKVRNEYLCGKAKGRNSAAQQKGVV